MHKMKVSHIGYNSHLSATAVLCSLQFLFQYIFLYIYIYFSCWGLLGFDDLLQYLYFLNIFVYEIQENFSVFSHKHSAFKGNKK